ncbi:BrnT family toxin [Desulfobacterales bacterium HSG2]|nr:BrnT family toxin [Desulfobacterales bacterium HSG2]
MRFEWDPVKANINTKRHGISFEEAVESFFDPDAADDYDDEHSEYEARYNLIMFFESPTPVHRIYGTRR